MTNGPFNSEQIVSCMEASRAKYQTIDAVIEVHEYDWLDEPDGKNRLVASMNWTIRRTPQNSYIRDEAKLFVDGSEQPLHQTEIIAGSAGGWKRLKQAYRPSGSISEGTISKQPFTVRHHGVLEALWGLGSDIDGVWSQITNIIRTEGQVSQDNGLVRLESRRTEKANATWLILWIDPQKEYVPVRLSMLHPDKKTLAVTQSTADWTLVNSLWVPLSYNRYLYPLKGRQEYKVLSIKINEPISPSDLDFDFPIGTCFGCQCCNRL